MSDDASTMVGSPAALPERRLEVPGYDLTSQLGSGGFGQVWAATHLRTGQKVAVKLLTGRSGIDWMYFQHEIVMLRSVAEHPHIVTLIDADLNHDPPYLVMPQMGGGSLAEQGGKPIHIERLQSWIEQTAQALHYAHGKGILHCDLKPSNVLLDDEDQVRLADFGQARRHGQEHAFGTIGYMAPEQMREEAPDTSWDIYGLGATAYFLLTGARPRLSEAALGEVRESKDGLSLCRELVDKNPLVPIRSLNPNVDDDLACIVEACLELDPARRTESASVVLSDLRRRGRQAPLLCRKPWSLRYRLDRFVRKPAIATSLLVPFLLLLFVNTYLSVRAINGLSREVFEHLRDVHNLARGQLELGRQGPNLGPSAYRHYLVSNQGEVLSAFNDPSPPARVDLTALQGGDVLAVTGRVGQATLVSEIPAAVALAEIEQLRKRSFLMTLLIVVATGLVALLAFRATGGDD